jgi:branched-chain amino acid transport system permease protein
LQAHALNRTLGEDILPPLLVTFGLSMVLQNGCWRVFRRQPAPAHFGALSTASIGLGGLNRRRHAADDLRLGVLVIVGLNQLFYRTELGRAFRATSDDPTTAQPDGHPAAASSPRPRASR